MPLVNRRTFLAAGAACAAAGTERAVGPRAAGRPSEPTPGVVRFFGDGLFLSPAEYADLLAKLARADKAGNDLYLTGGAVEALEARFAKELGKERAVYVPT